MQWDGRSWSYVPAVSAHAYSDANGVSCESTSACMIVGSSMDVGLRAQQSPIERLSRGTLTTLPTPQVGSSATLSGVSCSSTSVCVAVGSYSATAAEAREGIGHPLIETWSRGTWRVLPNVPTSPAGFGSLSSISCPRTSQCTAIGGSSPSPQGSRDSGNPISYQLSNGRWSSSQSFSLPSGTSAQDLSFRGVSCMNSTSCVAVGTVGLTSGSSSGQPIVETTIERR